MIIGKTNSFGAGGEDVYVIKTKKDVKLKEKIKFYNLRKSKETKMFDISGRKIEKIKKNGIYIKILDVKTKKIYYNPLTIIL